MHGRRFLTFCASCVFCVSCAFTVCVADPLDDLASPDYAVRQHATRSLLLDRSRSIDDLRALFTDARSPEQRHRLLDVIRHHLVRQLREQAFEDQGAASIGFSHEIVSGDLTPQRPDIPRGGAVHILATLPGFPGHAYFQPDDMIVAMDGQALPIDLTADSFQLLLRRWQAGQMLSFTVLRDGERMDFQLRLASLEALGAMYGNSPQLKDPYRSSWMALRAELLQSAPPVPVLGLDADRPSE